jgi:hypothetical protein
VAQKFITSQPAQSGKLLFENTASVSAFFFCFALDFALWAKLLKL